MSYENFKPEDLFISSYDAHGGGGWSPRVPAGIVVVHLPTGTVVKCHEHQSQHRNRHDALTALWDAVQGKQSYSVLAGQVADAFGDGYYDGFLDGAKHHEDTDCNTDPDYLGDEAMRCSEIAEAEKSKRIGITSRRELSGQVKELMKALEYADNKLYILTHNRTRSDISPRLLVDADKAYKVVGDTLKKFKQTAGDNNGTN